MTTYVLTYIAGAATGVGLLLWHQYSVRRATQRLTDEYRTRRENYRLRAELEELREIVDARERCDETREAMARGKIIGMRDKQNQTNYERFERAINQNGQREVKVGGSHE